MNDPVLVSFDTFYSLFDIGLFCGGVKIKIHINYSLGLYLFLVRVFLNVQFSLIAYLIQYNPRIDT